MTFVLKTASGHSEKFTDARAAGAAYCKADAQSMPQVQAGEMVPVKIAAARVEGEYHDGSARIVKDLPSQKMPGSEAFRGGYVEQLRQQVGVQLRAVNWEQAKPSNPALTPRLPEPLYDQIVSLAREDFTGAVLSWKENCTLPRDTYSPPALIDPQWKQQMEGVKAISEAYDTLRNKMAEPAQRSKAVDVLAVAAFGNQIASVPVQEMVRKEVAAQANKKLEAQAPQQKPVQQRGPRGR